MVKISVRLGMQSGGHCHLNCHEKRVTYGIEFTGSHTHGLLGVDLVDDELDLPHNCLGKLEMDSSFESWLLLLDCSLSR